MTIGRSSSETVFVGEALRHTYTDGPAGLMWQTSFSRAKPEAAAAATTAADGNTDTIYKRYERGKEFS